MGSSLVRQTEWLRFIGGSRHQRETEVEGPFQSVQRTQIPRQEAGVVVPPYKFTKGSCPFYNPTIMKTVKL